MKYTQVSTVTIAFYSGSNTINMKIAEERVGSAENFLIPGTFHNHFTSQLFTLGTLIDGYGIETVIMWLYPRSRRFINVACFIESVSYQVLESWSIKLINSRRLLGKEAISVPNVNIQLNDEGVCHVTDEGFVLPKRPEVESFRYIHRV